MAKAEQKLKQKRNKRLKIDPNEEYFIMIYEYIRLNQYSTTQAANRLENSNSFDIIITEFDLSFGSRVLLKNASVNLASGHRYGIVGRNGYGKTTFLKAIANGDLSIPKHITVLHVEQEVF